MQSFRSKTFLRCYGCQLKASTLKETDSGFQQWTIPVRVPLLDNPGMDVKGSKVNRNVKKGRLDLSQDADRRTDQAGKWQYILHDHDIRIT